MTLKEIEKRFIVETFYNGSQKDLNRFNIKSKTEQGMRYAGGKYLCTINRNDKKFFVDGCTPTDNLDVLEKQINDHVSSLPYDSEYYYPGLRKGLFETHIIHDYLRELGFKGGSHDEYYVLSEKNIYGFISTNLRISLYGLSVWGGVLRRNSDELSKEVEIALHTDEGWMNVTVKREVEAIKTGLETLLKPLMLTDGIKNIQMSDKMKHDGNVELMLSKIVGAMDSVSTDYRSTLKKKLLEMAETL